MRDLDRIKAELAAAEATRHVPAESQPLGGVKIRWGRVVAMYKVNSDAWTSFVDDEEYPAYCTIHPYQTYPWDTGTPDPDEDTTLYVMMNITLTGGSLDSATPPVGIVAAAGRSVGYLPDGGGIVIGGHTMSGVAILGLGFELDWVRAR